MKEVKEKKVRSREETEEFLETEDVQHLGDISDDVSTRMHVITLMIIARLLILILLLL